ncbi:hypothetical protein J2Z22_000855 [Paenibacillus forsythiae]|uniref:Uncharacterized protein n=1 Tax=Paenibacillus forsythiae TaxID=365616 RepID=A0ABU3H3E1_9BACL|nr:hypothetical protein [Paenibacillus forsythiae]MDT3425339.1 hypothetical protein [Paenibacillus forsythiae]
MKIMAIITLFILLAGWDAPHLIKKRQKKDLIVYFALILVGLTLSILVSFHVYLPNPSKGLETMFAPLGSWLKED